MAPLQRHLQRLARRPAKAINRAVARPVGAATRYGPLYGLNLVDRLVRGERTLERAVEGKVVLITGASSGIGEAAARRVADAGATTLMVARSGDKLDAIAADLRARGGDAHPLACDLTDLEAIDAMAASVLATHGGVDILVNNAGRSIRRSVQDSYDRFHDYERTMALNYFAPVRLILAFLPGMRERKSGQVVNMSTAGVLTRVPRFGAYIASKAALDTLSDSLQAEVQNQGVRFTTIHMSLVRTPMIAPTGVYDRVPALSPAEAGDVVADAIVYRPRRVSPLFGQAASIADAVSPLGMDILRNQGYRRVPD